MFKKFLAAGCAVLAMSGAVNATTLSGFFNVSVVNVTNANSAGSQATDANYSSAQLNALLGFNATSGSFTYDGALDFNVGSGNNDLTIAEFLASGSGTATENAGSTVGGLTNSSCCIGNGSAITTFYLFSAIVADAFDFSINHDDGVLVMDDGVELGGTLGPTGLVTTLVNGFDGGFLEILYVATNNNPSIFEVNAVAPIPVPAGLPLLLGAMGGLYALRRRQRAAA